MDAGDRFTFEAEWFDRFSSLTRKFSIVYYDADGTVEVAYCVVVADVAVICYGGAILWFSVWFRFLSPPHARRF
jgi:hypothetical protein